MKTKLALSILFLFLVHSHFAHAELYKWVDADGVTHYSNTAPPQEESVETTQEAKGSRPANVNRNGLSDVLQQYKEDIPSEHRSSSSGRSNSMVDEAAAERYASMIEMRKHDVDYWGDRLDKAKRASYSNKDQHERDIRYCEKMLEDYRYLLQEAQDGYNRAKFGR